MSSDRPTGPSLPPMFREEESDEDSDNEDGCKFKTKYPFFKTINRLQFRLNAVLTAYNRVIVSFSMVANGSLCLPPVLVSGPALPPGYKRGGPSSSSEESEPEVAVKRAKTKHAAAEKQVH